MSRFIIVPLKKKALQSSAEHVQQNYFIYVRAINTNRDYVCVCMCVCLCVYVPSALLYLHEIKFNNRR